MHFAKSVLTQQHLIFAYRWNNDADKKKGKVMSYLDEETRRSHHSSGSDEQAAQTPSSETAHTMMTASRAPVEMIVEGTITPHHKAAFLDRLRAVNVLRARQDFKTYDNASLLYFTTAIAGEIGELGEILELLAVHMMLSAKSGSLCNLVKKLERAKIGGPDHGNTTKLIDITPEKLRDEIGGIQIYLDLMASLLDIEIEQATTETFNNVSEKIGSKYRL